MTIECIDKTSFKLTGLPDSMYEDLDDEAHYTNYTGRVEQARDAYSVFLKAKGIVESPSMSETETRKLKRRFFHKRILDAARATDEIKWLKAARFRFEYPVSTYGRDGSIILAFANEDQALAFKLRW